MDPVTIVSFLVAASLGGAQKFVGTKIGSLLESLWNRVFGRLGNEPALINLRNTPQSAESQRYASDVISWAGGQDPRFRNELAQLQHELERNGAREKLAPYMQVYAPGAGTVISNQGSMGIRDINTSTYLVRDPTDMSNDRGWVKAAMWIGGVLMVLAFAIIAVSVANSASSAGPSTGIPDGVVVGAGVFFLAFVVIMAGSIGHSTTDRDRRR